MSREFALSNAGRAWLRRIETLHSGGPDPTLIAARRIARNSPEPPTVTGHTVHVTLRDRHQDAQLALEIPPWNTPDAALVDQLLHRHPISALDDLPDALLAALRENHIELAPRLGEIGLTPPEQPRRLALAAFYKLVQRIDEDPQLALALRQPPGRTQRSPTRAATRFVPLSALDPARFFVAPRA